MYQTASVAITTLSRSAGPVCITRLAIRPAKSFWKNVQLCRTTCQWFCQRIMLDKPGAIAWLVTRMLRQQRSRPRRISSTAAIPSSCRPCSRNSVAGVLRGDTMPTPPGR